ncbi:MAG: glycosyltransferase family 9 protein [Pseudomonadota bacterium]|uniref:glycosyltransferase family 9 protein n=1 Tax=Gallaecimonas pentaromativorans TaxID=584787 RepID=UPI00067E9E51|nr:glycosyltransferase family 9 protein [Gallaecimonas pentaromativorans]MED5526129.1 glycosyltransferase family 9 protein [Pseudomonadota bacterium]
MLKKLKAWWRGRRNARKARRLTKARAQWDKRFSDAPFSADTIKQVALLRWDDKLGDAITSTLFIEALTEHRPDIEITVLTGLVSAQLFKDMAGNVRVEVLEKRSWDTAKTLNHFAGKFDLVVELGSSLGDRDLFALHQLQAAHYLGYGKEDYQLFDVVLPQHCQHFADRYLAAAKLLCPAATLDRRFYVLGNPIAEAEAERFLAQLPIGPKVAINLFGSANHRQFNEEEALSLLSWWRSHFAEHQLLLLRVPGKDELLDKLAATGFAVTTPAPASLAMTMAVLRRVDLVFSPDTSVVHFAGALDKPLVAIYNNSPRNFAEWRPLSEKHAVVFTRAPTMANDKVKITEFDQVRLAEAIDSVLTSK